MNGLFSGAAARAALRSAYACLAELHDTVGVSGLDAAYSLNWRLDGTSHALIGSLLHGSANPIGGQNQVINRVAIQAGQSLNGTD